MNEIDMQSYTGELGQDAAVIQGDNAYLQETQESGFRPDLIEQPATEQEVPVELPISENPQAENFRALREEVDRLKQERETEKREHSLQMDILKANLQKEVRQPEPEPRKMFEGMRDDDVPNVQELRREWEQREAGYQARMEELQVQQQFPDYNEVLQKYVVPLVQQKPHLAEGIHGARNKALFAYELGKMAQQMQTQQQPVSPAPQATSPSTIAQKIVDNARKPGNFAQATGQGALSKADYYATMSDAEFAKLASKNLEQI